MSIRFDLWDSFFGRLASLICGILFLGVWLVGCLSICGHSRKNRWVPTTTILYDAGGIESDV